MASAKGYRWGDLKKGVLKDGHERSEMVSYRNDVFLPTLPALQPTFVQWTYADHDSDLPIPACLESHPPGTLPRIPATHDECSFNAKDRIKDDSIPFFGSDRESSIMVSKYLTPGCNLRLPADTAMYSLSIPSCLNLKKRESGVTTAKLSGPAV